MIHGGRTLLLKIKKEEVKWDRKGARTKKG
jgi:hypothetical protein